MIDYLISDAWALWLLKLWIVSGILSFTVVVCIALTFAVVAAWRVLR